jgi:hypothetical protein
MKMRRSAAELERAFTQEISRQRELRAFRLRTTERRMRKRQIARTHKRGSLRFALLVLALILTAVIVTVAMFATLYLLLG